MRPLPHGLNDSPETVGIEYEDRLFVWHAFEPQEDPITSRTQEFGPSVSVVVGDEEDERAAADSFQRFLSTIAFYYNSAAESTDYGGDGETDPYHPAVMRVGRDNNFGWVMTQPYDAMGLRPEPLLRLALAYYRRD